MAGGAAAVDGGTWASVTGITESNTRENPTVFATSDNPMTILV